MDPDATSDTRQSINCHENEEIKNCSMNYEQIRENDLFAASDSIAISNDDSLVASAAGVFGIGKVKSVSPEATSLFTFLGSLSALASTLTLMSLQPLWYIIKGPSNFYGLLIFIYDAFFLISIPVYCWMAGNRRDRFIASIVGSLCLVMGGFGYVWIFYYEKQLQLLFAMRLLQGIGGGMSLLGTVCTFQYEPALDVLTSLQAYRNSQDDAKFWWGPMFLGFLSIILPYPRNEASMIVKLFNFYTINTWLLTFLLVTFLILLFSASHPLYNTRIKETTFDIRKQPHWDKIKFRSTTIFILFIIQNIIDFIMYFCIWSVYWNIFSISAAQYRLLNYQREFWKVFIPIGFGGIFGSFFNFYWMCKPFQRYRFNILQHPELVSMIASVISLFLTFLLFATNFEINDQPVKSPFYFAAFFFGLSIVWYASSTIINTHRFISNQIAQDAQNTLLVISMIVGYLGGSFGSLVSSSLLVITDDSHTSNSLHCPDSSSSSSDSISIPSGSLSDSTTGNNYVKIVSYCCITAEKFYVDSCKLNNFHNWSICLLLLIAFNLVIMIGYTRYLCSYIDERGARTQKHQGAAAVDEEEEDVDDIR